MEDAETLISAEQIDTLMEQIIARAATCAHNTEVLVVEGLVPTRQHPFADEINSAIAKALDADVVFVGTPGTDTPKEFNKRLKITHQSWGGKKNKSLIGSIINKVNAPVDEEGRTRPDLSEVFDPDNTDDTAVASFDMPAKTPIKILGQVPYNVELVAPRSIRFSETPECKNLKCWRHAYSSFTQSDLLCTQYS